MKINYQNAIYYMNELLNLRYDIYLWINIFKFSENSD